MTVVSFAVDVDAAPEDVWSVVADPRHLPHWDRHIADVEGLPSDGLHEGAAYTTVMRFMGVRARVAAKVIAWDPPRHAVIRLSGLVDATVTTSVSDLGEGRSRLRHDVDYRFRGGPLGDLAARSVALVGGAQYALRHGVLAQKREIEEGV